MGVVAEHVGDLGLARATDSHILDAASERHAVWEAVSQDRP
jgi:predicted nuclease of predicted toxin-antitoxin system